MANFVPLSDDNDFKNTQQNNPAKSEGIQTGQPVMSGNNPDQPVEQPTVQPQTQSQPSTSDLEQQTTQPSTTPQTKTQPSDEQSDKSDTKQPLQTQNEQTASESQAQKSANQSSVGRDETGNKKAISLDEQKGKVIDLDTDLDSDHGAVKKPTESEDVDSLKDDFDEDKYEKRLVEDIKLWIKSVKKVVKERSEKGYNVLITVGGKLNTFTENFDAIYKKGRMTNEEKISYLEAFSTFCKDIQHNLIENVEVGGVKESLKSLAFIMYMLDFGYEIVGDVLLDVTSEDKRYRFRYVREHYFNAYSGISNKRVAIGQYTDPFEM